MSKAKATDTVTIHFSAHLDDGTELENTLSKEPFSFQLGTGAVVPGLEAAVLGMATGERKIASLKPAEAFGERRDDLIQSAARTLFGEDMELAVGARVGAETPDGETIELTILSLTEDEVVLDANHPLAGMDVTYRIELLSISPA